MRKEEARMAYPAKTEGGSAAEVFFLFLRLGASCFGGHVSTLARIRHEVVIRRRWLEDEDHAGLVALCHLLPGLTLAQLALALGWRRARGAGAIAAVVAFVLPAAVMLAALIWGMAQSGTELPAGLVQGVVLAAIAMLLRGIWRIGQEVCPDRERATIALAAVILLAVAAGPMGRWAALLFGLVAGAMLGKARPIGLGARDGGIPVALGLTCAAIWAAGLLFLPLLAPLGFGLSMADLFYRSGALAFGGGHGLMAWLVPEISASNVLGADTVWSGYALAQALPGPMSSMALWLGPMIEAGGAGIGLALLGMTALLAPGLLLTAVALAFWPRLGSSRVLVSALQGGSAATLGMLATILYAPLLTTQLSSQLDLALMLACLLALTLWRCPAWAVLVMAAFAGSWV